mmetsp:Transcript_14775/g.57954  ORF Transcript_14775/g.57954 Transcript_14775/m.57954 type:complete len:390 (-) Transcript_14775:127-1296(-)
MLVQPRQPRMEPEMEGEGVGARLPRFDSLLELGEDDVEEECVKCMARQQLLPGLEEEEGGLVLARLPVVLERSAEARHDSLLHEEVEHRLVVPSALRLRSGRFLAAHGCRLPLQRTGVLLEEGEVGAWLCQRHPAGQLLAEARQHERNSQLAETELLVHVGVARAEELEHGGEGCQRDLSSLNLLLSGSEDPLHCLEMLEALLPLLLCHVQPSHLHFQRAHHRLLVCLALAQPLDFELCHVRQHSGVELQLRTPLVSLQCGRGGADVRGAGENLLLATAHVDDHLLLLHVLEHLIHSSVLCFLPPPRRNAASRLTLPRAHNLFLLLQLPHLLLQLGVEHNPRGGSLLLEVAVAHAHAHGPLLHFDRPVHAPALLPEAGAWLPSLAHHEL